jgi:hypothetical protein
MGLGCRLVRMATQAVEMPRRTRVAGWLISNLVLSAIVLTSVTTAVSVLVSRALAPDTHALAVRVGSLERQLHFSAAQDVLDRFDRAMRQLAAENKPSPCARRAYRGARLARQRPDQLFLKQRWGLAASGYQKILGKLVLTVESCPDGQNAGEGGPYLIG